MLHSCHPSLLFQCTCLVSITPSHAHVHLLQPTSHTYMTPLPVLHIYLLPHDLPCHLHTQHPANHTFTEPSCSYTYASTLTHRCAFKDLCLASQATLSCVTLLRVVAFKISFPFSGLQYETNALLLHFCHGICSHLFKTPHFLSPVPQPLRNNCLPLRYSPFS